MKKKLDYLETALTESKEIFKIVFENSPEAITVTDKEERIVAWNPMAEKLLGMDKNDLFNKPVKELYPIEEWQIMRGLNIRKTGWLSDIHTRLIRKDGSLLDVSASITVLKDAKGDIVGAIGVLRDLSKQKIFEEQLLQAKLIAEEANQAKSVFLAKMSHEVRTPMNAIIGMLDLTLDTPLTEEQKDNINVAKDAADNLLSLINDILDLSRAQAGKVVIEEVEINVCDIVKNICKALSVLARQKNIDLVWEIDPKLPRLMMGDPVRLRQVLVNIINNAVKFTNKGRVTVNVKVDSLRERDCLVTFEVIDQGIGIPARNIANIFDVFTEAHNTTARRYGGTGLGLAICKKLVEMMRGLIVVESKEGVGSTFRFQIIFSVNPDLLRKHAHHIRDELHNIGLLPESLLNLRILLAEDDPVNQRIGLKTIEKFGWKVTAVSDGQEVLDILAKQAFDIILMDDSMPKLSGIETTHVIRREEKQTGMHIPIIAMTANAMAGDRERYIAEGMDGYVSKPFDRSVLYNEIVNLVAQRQG